MIDTKTRPVEAALIVTYLQFPIQAYFLCIGQPVTDIASITNNFRHRQPCGFNNSNDEWQIRGNVVAFENMRLCVSLSFMSD